MEHLLPRSVGTPSYQMHPRPWGAGRPGSGGQICPNTHLKGVSVYIRAHRFSSAVADLTHCGIVHGQPNIICMDICILTFLSSSSRIEIILIPKLRGLLHHCEP